MSETTISKPARRAPWQCGFCGSGNHERCTGAAVSGGKIMRCACKVHPLVQRCLECGNTRGEELTDWACTNPTDCADAIAARSASNPLRKELETVKALGGEARRRALDERLQREIRRAVAVCGIDDQLGDDVARNRPPTPRARTSRASRPRTGQCVCGCAGQTKGGKFQPGHDAKLKSALKKAIVEGDATAYERMVELGWERFAVQAVKLRQKALAV